MNIKSKNKYWAPLTLGWILLVVSTVLFLGTLVGGQQRDPSISALLERPSLGALGGSIGVLFGSNFITLLAFAVGISSWKINMNANGKWLVIASAVLFFMISYKQVLPNDTVHIAHQQSLHQSDRQNTASDTRSNLVTSGRDYVVADVQDVPQLKKFISTKYNFSIIYPSDWALVDNMMKYSVAKFRSEDGKGLEILSIDVVPLDDKQQYSIADIKNSELPAKAELIGLGEIQILNQTAVWKHIYVTGAGIISDDEIKKLLLYNPAMTSTVANSCGMYMVQFIRNNQLYTIGCSSLGQSREVVLNKFDTIKRFCNSTLGSLHFEDNNGSEAHQAG